MTQSDSAIDCALFAQFPMCDTREDALAQAGVLAATLAPSLRAQTDPDFVLVIAHDPDISVAALRRLENVLGAVRTVFAPTDAPIADCAAEFLRERAAEPDARLFVISADMGDVSPAPGYIAALRAAAEERLAHRARRALLIGGEALEVNLMLWRMRAVGPPECDPLGAAYMAPLDPDEETIYDYMSPTPAARARELGVDVRRLGPNLALRNRSRAAESTRPRHLRDLQGPRSASLDPEILATFSIDETDATHAAENESWLTPTPAYFRRGLAQTARATATPAAGSSLKTEAQTEEPRGRNKSSRAGLRRSAVRLWRSLMRNSKVD